MRAIRANPASPLGENDFFRNQTGKLGLYHIPENKIRRFVKISQLRAFSALCATVGFSAITSANVVGYMSKDMAAAGYYNYTPMFVSADGTDPAVKDIVPSSTEKTDLSGGVIMMYVLDTNRKFAKGFSWLTVDDLMEEDGWYLGAEETVTDYKLQPGESLQVKAPYQVSFTFAGQVDQGAYDFTAPVAGYYMVGNQHATEMPVKDIIPSSTEKTDLSGGVIMMYVLDTNRKFAKGFSWLTVDDLMEEDGWYLGSEETVTDYKLKPGEVLQVYAPYQVKLSFPSQEIK